MKWIIGVKSAAGVMFGVFAVGPAYATDCGAGRNARSIEETKRLVQEASPVVLPISEFTTAKGTRQCVRFTFLVSPWGTPYYISVAESSGDASLEFVAANALRRYRFTGSFFSVLRTRTLVFSELMEKNPSPR